NAGGEFEVAENAADGLLEVALQVTVAHAGHLHSAYARDVDSAIAVYCDVQVDVNHAPAADVQLVAGADQVVRVDLDGIDRREGAVRIREQFRSEYRKLCTGDAFHVVFEGECAAADGLA